MSDVEKLVKMAQSLETSLKKLEVGLVMVHLMVRQLDGRVEIDDKTMGLYVDVLTGEDKAAEFAKYVVERYYT